METHAESSELQTRTMRRVAARLMPVLLGLYIIAYLDRVNVTFAQDKLESDLGFSGAVYGFGAGIFFIAYFIFEVPSNLALHRFGARKWIARIMVTWGDHLRLHDVRAGAAELLRRPLPARHRRGRLLPRHDPVPVVLVPGPRAGARRRLLHVGDRDLLRHRRAGLRRHHVGVRRRRRAPGLAVAVPDRGDPRAARGRLRPVLPRRRARGREVAPRRREALAGRAPRG